MVEVCFHHEKMQSIHVRRSARIFLSFKDKHVMGFNTGHMSSNHACSDG